MASLEVFIHKCREWLIARKRRRPASSDEEGVC